MMFFELFIPKGTLNEEQRRRLGERLITGFMREEEVAGTPAAVLEASHSIWQVVVHEIDTWIVAGRQVEAGAPPRYVVRVSIPEAWRKQMSAEVITRVTGVLAEADGDPQRLYDEPVAWVHVIGVPEGSLGIFGQVMRSTDIVKLITKPFRESPERDVLIAAAAAGTAIDPICGMTVPLTDTAITLEHNDITYAFCSASCHKVFLEELRELTR